MQQAEKTVEAESKTLPSAVKTQTEPAAVKTNIQTQTVSPVQPAVAATKTTVSQTPAAATTAVAPAVVNPVVSQPTNQQAVAPAKKDAAPVIEEKALPAEPASQSSDAAPAQPSLSDLPLKEGVYMIAPLEAEMKLAAQQLDFEKAIQIRNQIQQIKQIEGVSEIIELEQRMIFAAQELRFEEAIQLRDQIKELQLKISTQEVEAKKPEVKFQVQSFSIKGNEVFTSEELLAYTTELVNKDITLSDVREAARKIKQHYRDKGFIAAYVFIPKGALKDGDLELTIVEGKIGEVRVEGNKHFSDEVLTNYINYMKLMPGDTAMFQNVRNYLSQLNDHRDISAKATFQPGANSETTDLIVNVQDKNPFHVSMDYNNFGTDLSGQDRFGTTISHTNLLGNMDEIMFRTQLSEATEAYAIDYNTPIGLEDWRAGFAYSRGDVNLTGDFKALNAESNANTYSIYAVKPLSYEADLKSKMRFGFDHKSSQSQLLGIQTGRDELRILNFLIDLEQTDAYGKTYWPNSFHYGIDAFGASNKNDESLNRAHTGAPFFIYRSQLDRFLYMPNDMLLQLHSAWQLSPDKLPSAEQFQLGGINTVRGYPQGEYLGDYGVVASGELSFPLYGLPKGLKLPGDKASLYDTTRLVSFYDFGHSSLKGPLPGEGASKTVQGAGLGLRMRLYDRINAQVEYAWPLADAPSDGSDGAWYYGVSMDVI